MKMSYLYSHLIDIESVVSELDKLDISGEQKVYLSLLIDSSLHHTIVDAVLSELPPQDKRIFLQTLFENDHSKIWQFLNEKIDLDSIEIEEKIKKVADQLTTELHKDLTKAVRIKLNSNYGPNEI